MRRIGITTFHRATNYGAVLQAYALQKYISNLGYDVKLIDYCCKINDHSDLTVLRKYIKNPLRAIGSYNVRKKCIKFNGFVNQYIKITDESYTRENINQIDENQFDLVITGSDQVWNPDIIRDENAFLLDFIKNDKMKFAYAASIGLSDIDTQIKERYIKCLRNYNRIAVREKCAVEILDSCGIQDVELVCDPTLLLDMTSWIKLEKKVNTPDKYILLFGFNNDVLPWRCANYLKEKTGYEICMIGDKIRKTKGYTQFSAVGPQEWLYLIHHAGYIITNSFHGMMFSIIFHNKFCIYDPKDGTNIRLIEMLENAGCVDRLIDENNLKKIMNDIDYERVDQELSEYISKSKDYLKTILTSNQEDI